MSSTASHRRPLRGLLKQAFVVLTLLLAPLAQASVVHVCSMMGGTVATDCCCDESQARPSRTPSASDGCCSVSVERRGPEFAGAAIAPSSQRSERSAGDVPPMAVESLPSVAVPAFTGYTSFAPTDVRSRGSARSLYLLTARLRL